MFLWYSSYMFPFNLYIFRHLTSPILYTYRESGSIIFMFHYYCNKTDWPDDFFFGLFEAPIQ